MSHIVKCSVSIKNESALNAAIAHLGLTNLGNRQHKLFDGTYEGVGVTLPGWKYPVVINLNEGQARFDNYGGNWGKQVELDKLVQRYSIECMREDALINGYNVDEMSAQSAFEAGLIDEMPQDAETLYLHATTIG